MPQTTKDNKYNISKETIRPNGMYIIVVRSIDVLLACTTSPFAVITISSSIIGTVYMGAICELAILINGITIGKIDDNYKY